MFKITIHRQTGQDGGFEPGTQSRISGNVTVRLSVMDLEHSNAVFQ